ncbi:E3 ubiquitin-protein ligase RFWD3-like [Physella acuta]|uniref:E3 ubiquitin-protein ligase RFWD3-like n=1 Tax=Physella acuta TaxID=109671 RepID=UPI0027DDF144|nr:E3 ubiquitin-protein ligase RFWD3-like [Physella acuta]
MAHSSNEEIISLSSSEDEEGASHSSAVAATRDREETVRELIHRAMGLLNRAENNSRPEPFRLTENSAYRYKFSSQITASDLFRESELLDLFETVSILKARLSAERVFSLGCPHVPTEREIFDELVMRYSHEFIDSWRAADNPQLPAPHTTEAAHTDATTSHIRENTESMDTSSLNCDAPRENVEMTGRQVQPPYTSPRCKKRKRADMQEDKKQTDKIDDNAEEEDEDCCSVCLEPWTTGGEHRITCLRCGHLFGLSCILKWVEQAHSCPQCKAPAKKTDLRNIFVRKITAEDTSERDRALKQLEEERAARRVLEQKEAVARHKMEVISADYEVLKREMNNMKSQISQSGGSMSPSSSSYEPRASNAKASPNYVQSHKKYHFFQRIPIAQDANCRVFDFCREMGIIVVSQKSPNALFRGFGIKLLSRDFKPLSYQPLHSGVIRDMCFRPMTYDGQLLSCGMDKCILMSSVSSKAVILKYTVNMPVWSCAWNTSNNNIFYAGMERGVVKEFDIRRTDSHVQNVLDNGVGPVSSIQFWNGAGSTSNNYTGLLIGQLQNVIFKECVPNNQYTTHLLPSLQASLMSMSLHPSGHFLTSFRPNTNLPKCKYELYSLSENTADVRTISSTHVAAWKGSNLQAVISRNTLISRPESEEENLLAVTANHYFNSVHIWDVTRKQDFQLLQCFDKAVDMKSINVNQSCDYLGVLTDKEFILYKWRD